MSDIQCEDARKFLELKWRKFFTILDADHNGTVSRKDHKEMGERFAAASSVSEARKAEIRQHFVTIWEQVFEKDGKIDEVDPEYFMDLFYRHGSHGFNNVCKFVCPIMFQAIDADGDGMIQVEEFNNFFSLFYKDTKQATRSFEIIDTNKDGTLSLEEFTNAFTEFLSGIDQKSPYQYFFGSLDVL